MNNYKAGNIKNHLQQWKNITSDFHILDIVKNGLKLDFIGNIPSCPPYEYGRNENESMIINEEIAKLLKKGVIAHTDIKPNDFFSSVFTRPKKDGSKRMILNLKNLNEFILSPHFKMDSIYTVINMIKPNVWMASVDLKDAYFSVPINEKHQNFFKFMWKVPYKFLGMPNGYGPAMLKFTKIMKPPFSFLRKKGHQSVVFVDDSYLQSDTYHECEKNITDTVQLLISLGFTIHAEKSVLVPKQEIIFLGFVINSVKMTLTLTEEKKQKIKEMCEFTLNSKKLTIRHIASLLGNFTAAIEAVPYSKLHYRSIECSKIEHLKREQGNFEATFKLSQENINEIKWWQDNIGPASRSLLLISVDYKLFTDASKLGWGAEDDKSSTGGQWTMLESGKHINIQELHAAYLGIKSLSPAYCKHIRIMIDNTTAVAYVNKMGGTASLECNYWAKQIWNWAILKNIWISAAHVPGKENGGADFQSRNFSVHKSSDWTLSEEVFQLILKHLGRPDIDMFASRINYKIPKYVSWKPDPECYAVDAFSLEWSGYFPFCFPPFSLISKVLRWIQMHQVDLAIVVAPMWTTQAWFPTYVNMMVSPPLVFPSTTRYLYHPYDPSISHSLASKMRLMVALLSADASKCQAFRHKLRTSYYTHGGMGLDQNTREYSENGTPFVIDGTKIPFLQMFV